LTRQAAAGDKFGPNAEAIRKAIANLQTTNAVSSDPLALRAVLITGSKGYDVGAPLDAALGSLKQPAQWPRDKRIAFAAALAAAERAGKAPAADLEAAAKLLTADQQTDGSYGSTLDTWLARVALISSGMQPDNFTIVQIDKWSRGLTVENLSDATTALLVLEMASDVMADNLRRTSLQIMRQAQRPNGGFAASEGAPGVYDTALAVVALAVLDVEPRLARSTYRPEELKEAIANGKAFLMSQQRPDGSWPEGTAANAWALTALVSGS